MMTVLAINSLTLGGLLFLLSAGFSLIFGLMRIPNLTHGSLFMVGAYLGATFVLRYHLNFWVAALLAALLVAAIGAGIERLLLRHDELKRTNALLEQQLASVTHERDNLRSRLNAARGRIDALLERLPADPAAVGADTGARSK